MHASDWNALIFFHSFSTAYPASDPVSLCSWMDTTTGGIFNGWMMGGSHINLPTEKSYRSNTLKHRHSFLAVGLVASRELLFLSLHICFSICRSLLLIVKTSQICKHDSQQLGKQLLTHVCGMKEVSKWTWVIWVPSKTLKGKMEKKNWKLSCVLTYF